MLQHKDLLTDGDVSAHRELVLPRARMHERLAFDSPWPAFPLSGAASLTIEAAAVLPEGRISYADVGLWNDETEFAIGRTLESIRRWSDMPIVIQLSRAGRKASTEAPWKGGAQFAPHHPIGWQTVAPSPIPYADGQLPLRSRYGGESTLSLRHGPSTSALNAATETPLPEL
jgi:hypothetical protein